MDGKLDLDARRGELLLRLLAAETLAAVARGEDRSLASELMRDVARVAFGAQAIAPPKEAEPWKRRAGRRPSRGPN